MWYYTKKYKFKDRKLTIIITFNIKTISNKATGNKYNYT